MSSETTTGDSAVKIESLLELFYPHAADQQRLGEFTPCSRIRDPYDSLLNHEHHMTVTVERHCGETVHVQVHRVAESSGSYAREITLVAEHSKKIVQYGIVRLNVGQFDPVVWRQIAKQEIPLGRILIEHQVMREVELCGLWKVVVGPGLAERMQLTSGDTTYGRTARIHCDGKPAIELLEIVAPMD